MLQADYHWRVQIGKRACEPYVARGAKNDGYRRWPPTERSNAEEAARWSTMQVWMGAHPRISYFQHDESGLRWVTFVDDADYWRMRRSPTFWPMPHAKVVTMLEKAREVMPNIRQQLKVRHWASLLRGEFFVTASVHVNDDKPHITITPTNRLPFPSTNVSLTAAEGEPAFEHVKSGQTAICTCIRSGRW